MIYSSYTYVCTHTHTHTHTYTRTHARTHTHKAPSLVRPCVYIDHCTLMHKAQRSFKFANLQEVNKTLHVDGCSVWLFTELAFSMLSSNNLEHVYFSCTRTPTHLILFFTYICMYTHTHIHTHTHTHTHTWASSGSFLIILICLSWTSPSGREKWSVTLRQTSQDTSSLAIISKVSPSYTAWGRRGGEGTRQGASNTHSHCHFVNTRQRAATD